MLLWIIGILLFLCAAVCIYCFYTCFYSANSKPQDPYGMLHGEQFIALKEKIYKCTKHMESVPFEPVTTKSDRKSTRLNSSHANESRMPSSA